jgi:hypothetical protein
MREPTNEERRLMIIGGFETLEEFAQWMHTPLDPAILAKLEEPDYEEALLEQIRREAEGMDPDEEILEIDDDEDLEDDEPEEDEDEFIRQQQEE